MEENFSNFETSNSSLRKIYQDKILTTKDIHSTLLPSQVVEKGKI